MKRYNALATSLALAVGVLVVLLVLISGPGQLPVAVAHSVTVDGNLNDWKTTFPSPPVNNGHVMRNSLYEGEFLWSDASNDARVVGTDPDSNYELTEMRVTADSSDLYFLLRLADVTAANRPYVAVAVDTDRASGSGKTAFEDSAGVQTHTDAAWERQIIANSNRTGYFDTASSFTSAGTSVISAAADAIEVSMPLAALGIDLTDGAVVRFTVFVGEHDGSGGLVIYGGRGPLDVVTTQDDTADELTNGVIDYFFDVYFERDGDPTSPLQISEVFFDPVGSTPLEEYSNQFLEMFNPAQYLAYLDGKVLGDEPSDTIPGFRDREAIFQFPGNLLTGTTYPVQPGEYVVVATDAREYDDEQDFPDHHWADWEFFQGLVGEFDHPDVPDLTLVFGNDTGNWDDNQMSWGSGGDGAFVADGTVTTPVPLSYTFASSHTIVDGVNWQSWQLDAVPADTGVADKDVPGGQPNAPQGESIQRDYSRVVPDTDDSATDFEPQGAPTPGFAKGLIDHAIYKKGPSEVVVGDTFNYYIYYQVAGQTAPSAAITDVLPSGVDLVGFSASSLVTLTDSTEPTLVWDLGDVPASTIGKITVTVQLDPSVSMGVITQTAFIGSQSGVAEGITDNDSYQLPTLVRAPELAITKGVSLPHDPAHPGDSVTYTVVVANTGDADATSVRVTDTLPSGVTGTDLDATVTVTAGDQVEFSIPAVVTTNPAFYGQTIINTAYYSHITGSGSDAASFTIVEPELTLAKTVEPSAGVEPGGTVTYTVSIANNSPADATAVRVTDTLPSEVTFGGWVNRDIANPALPVDTITWGPRDVASGVAFNFSFTATVSSDMSLLGSSITNTAEFDSGNAGSGSDDASFFVRAKPIFMPLIYRNF